MAYHEFEAERAVGGGGPGEAGGGGGGSAGAAEQRLQFVRLQQGTAPDVTVVKPSIPPPVSLPVPPRPVTTAAPAETAPVATGNAGAGAGSGGPGAGSGKGGGTGSGIGTGTGSASGPGTGGGPGVTYPPTPTQFFLPPLPAPQRVKPYHLVAWFDVDEKGNATLLGFNPSRDGGYNRRLREVLLALRFRPGVRPDGTPVRDTVDVQFIF